MVEVQFAARFGNGCHFWTSGAQLPIHQTGFGFTDKSAHQVFKPEFELLFTYVV